VVPGAIEVDRPADGPGTVAVLLDGIEEGVAGRTASTLQLLGSDAREQADLPDGWGAFPWSPQGKQTALKATFALSGLARVLDAARSAADAAGARLDLRGSGGAGVLYGAIAADADAAAVGEVVRRLRATCTEVGGALVVLDGPAEVKAAVDTWGPIPALDLMQRVKERFDPERRLAPGRFVGGI
jgi:glycolate oxidase FAD binding subunit